MKLLHTMGLVIGLGCVMHTAYAEQTVVLTSLSWPPYTDGKLPNGGASAAVARAAFKAMGYNLKIEFLPWSRAVDEAKNNPKVMGYFPEYYSDDLKNHFHLSVPMGNGPLGLAQRKGAGYSWKTLPELSHKKLGVVRDYVNTQALDERIAKKQQLVDVAGEDSQNLLKLNGGQIDLAVVDENVFNYLLKNNPRLKSAQGKLEMNPRLLENKKLYICFKRTPEGGKWAKVFAEGLKKINVQAIMEQNLK